MNYELNHSRYIGSRRSPLSAREERIIKRAALRAKSNARKMQDRREEKLREIGGLGREMASERDAGRFDNIPSLWSRAQRLIFQLYVRSHAAKLPLYLELEAHYRWAVDRKRSAVSADGGTTSADH